MKNIETKGDAVNFVCSSCRVQQKGTNTQTFEGIKIGGDLVNDVQAQTNNQDFSWSEVSGSLNSHVAAETNYQNFTAAKVNKNLTNKVDRCPRWGCRPNYLN